MPLNIFNLKKQHSKADNSISAFATPGTPAQKKIDVFVVYPKITTSNCQGIVQSSNEWFRDVVAMINTNYSGDPCNQDSTCAGVHTSVDCTPGSQTFATITISLPSSP